MLYNELFLDAVYIFHENVAHRSMPLIHLRIRAVFIQITALYTDCELQFSLQLLNFFTKLKVTVKR